MSRLLVVEDDPDIALALRLLFSRAGYEVAHAGDGRTGLKEAYAEHPDLVVLDVGLPEMDGWQVLERLRDVSDVPVLVLTAHGQEAEKVRGLRGGADDYLTKPFANNELRARVARAPHTTPCPSRSPTTSCCPGWRRCCAARPPARTAGPARSTTTAW